MPGGLLKGWPGGKLQGVKRVGPGGLLQIDEGAGSGVRFQNAGEAGSNRWPQKTKRKDGPSGRSTWVGSGGVSRALRRRGCGKKLHKL